MIVTTLLSGGMDSVAALHRARQQYPFAEHVAFSVDYGQPHRCELLHAAAVTSRLGVWHRTICVADALLPGPVGLHSPGVMALDRRGRDTAFIPARNHVLLSLAACHIVAHYPGRGNYVFTVGFNGEDGARFPDCTDSFRRSMADALTYGLGERINIYAPWLIHSKAEVLRWAAECGEPVLDDCLRSWSCYRGDPTPCGICTACAYRAAAVADCGLTDRSVRLATTGGDVARDASLRR